MSLQGLSGQQIVQVRMQSRATVQRIQIRGGRLDQRRKGIAGTSRKQIEIILVIREGAEREWANEAGRFQS